MVPGQEDGERLEEMMVALEIVSRHCPADLKVEEIERESTKTVSVINARSILK